MASFTKRNGNWRVRIRRTGYPSLTKSFQTKAQAIKWSQDMERRLGEGCTPLFPSEPFVHVSDLLKRYRERVTETKKGSSVESYRIRALERSWFGEIELKNLDSRHVADYRDQRLSEVTTGTVLKELGLLSVIINTAISEWGLRSLIGNNPVSGTNKPRAPRPRNRRLEDDELKRLLKACSSPLFRAVILFAIETGMRRGEILSLTWENVYLEKRYVHLLDTKNGDSRDVPLSPMALELLRELPRNIRGDQVVFPIHYEALKSAWCRACDRAGICNLRFHDLRHEATSRFYEKGLNVMEVAAITGHKDLRMLQRYTHLRAEDLARKLE